ncbi:MAG TPA: hypothetical protein VGB63_14610 [Pedobacter sp.]|jgi:hypothetical protein
MNKRLLFAGSFVLLMVSIALAGFSGKDKVQISIVTDKARHVSVMHGLTKLTNALKEKKISFEEVNLITEAQGETVIVTGLGTDDGIASQLMKKDGHALPQVPEALTIWKTKFQKKPVWVISGFDNRGLMYGLLEVANRIEWSNDRKFPMSEVKEMSDKPDVKERAISIYTMNRAYWESRLYNKNYWEKYLDMLAQNRFNSLVVIFGYENGGFLAPPYPYFFDVEGYPEVKMTGISPAEQKRNLGAFNQLIKMAHNRGIKFTVGIWDHIYRGGGQAGGIPGAEKDANQLAVGVVSGLSGENLMPYTKTALAKFIKLVPDLDAIQFRMHAESGLKDGEQEAFWLDVFKSIKETAPNMKLVLRAKGILESVIQGALDVGVNFTISTKYWMEQMGMPYHPTHINRENQFDLRQSYGNMLRYPQQYKFHWRLWNGGTTRILLWGDPEYVRRFAETTHLYDGDGYEVNEPLATKMHGQPHNAVPFNLLNLNYRYYDYEFERYWHFFQVFGRLGYNPETSPDVWKKEFERRFGKKAAPLIEKALHQASWILPRIVASVYHYDSSFPTTRGWPEKQSLGSLPLYAKGEGSDIQQFASFDEEAQILIGGGETAKILPSLTSHWFEHASSTINKLITEAEKVIGNNRNKEFNSTITDLKILSNLALYHSRRIPAAVNYRLFERTNDVTALDNAIAHERKAIDAWQKIVVSAGDIYADDLMMGVPVANDKNNEMQWIKRLSGHWKDELELLQQELSTLEHKRLNINLEENVKTAPPYKAKNISSYHNSFQVSHQPITSAPIDQPLKIRIKVTSPARVKWVRLRYRNLNQHQDYQTLKMLPSKERDEYEAVIPSAQINTKWDFMYFIEIMDNNGNGIIYPDLHKETPYVVVKVIR